MKILLGKSVLFKDVKELDANTFLQGREFETKQMRLRFPDTTYIIGRWENKRSCYVLYCIQDLGDINEMDFL